MTVGPPPDPTVFLLAGRYFQARAKRQSGAALRALLDLASSVFALSDSLRLRRCDPQARPRTAAA